MGEQDDGALMAQLVQFSEGCVEGAKWQSRSLQVPYQANTRPTFSFSKNSFIKFESQYQCLCENQRPLSTHLSFWLSHSTAT